MQTRKLELITVDSYDNCLKLFNRLQDRIINKFAGDCKKAGYRDGRDALFNWPQSVIQDNQTPCLLYLTDFLNAAVRIPEHRMSQHWSRVISNGTQV